MMRAQYLRNPPLRLLPCLALFFFMACFDVRAVDIKVAQLADLVAEYKSHLTSIGFKTTNTQEIVSKDLSRPAVVADITTNLVDMWVKSGKAIVSHKAFIGRDDKGDLIGADTHAMDGNTHSAYSPLTNQGVVEDIDDSTRAKVFARDRVLSYLYLQPPGFEGPGLDQFLRKEGVVLENEKELLFGDEVIVLGFRESKLWIDASHGGILRQFEERSTGRLTKRIEVSALTKVGDVHFPKTIKYTSYNATLNDDGGNALPYLVCTMEIDPQSLRVNDLRDDELVFDFPKGTSVLDKRTGANYNVGG